MSKVRRFVRQVLTIARRDFVATVFTPVFLLFLFAPVVIGSFSLIGGLGASAAANSGSDRVRVVAIVPDALARPIAEADTRLRGAFKDAGDAPPELTTLHPENNTAGQARRTFTAHDFEAAAVLSGPLDHPRILYTANAARSARYLELLAQTTLAAQQLGGALPRVATVRELVQVPRPSAGTRNQSAFFAVFGVFFLTLFLAGQVVGTMAEERNNKVIEVLAAAVPLEAVFGGKLIGMFGVAVLFVGFWATVIGRVTSLLPPSFAHGLAELTPAVGGGSFALLFCAYFAMAYLLLGSVFLGIGAQASTMREIQMLSLPITLVQVGMFALATAAASHPGSGLATFAQVFPLSSPFAMAGRAASSPELWPHLLALGWQALWVAIFIAVGARLFRRGVLQSGSARPFWRRQRPIDTGVS
ncbi:ABC transporter permease [Sphingomonas sp.]|uniref:ABC transporter permease n=1 Tax=Sphingomonas sp. TaxID=28214 RepID=UPI003CC615E0